MPGKQLAEEIALAMDEASRQALHEAITRLPSDTTLGSLLNDLGASRAGVMLRSLPLSDVGRVLSTNNAGADQTVRGATGRKTKPRTKRTLSGSIRTYLRQAGKAKAEEIRAEVGGTPAEVRQTLFELREQKRVRRTGKGRATVWHWRS